MELKMVSVEIGKTYKVEPTYKKCVVDVEQWRADNDRFIEIEQVWRWGDWYITPQTKDECRLLEEAQDEEKKVYICLTDFEEYELNSTWDSIWTEITEYWGLGWTEDKFKDFEERFLEDYETLEKEGFEPMDTETYINCSISVVEEDPAWK
jgi:hypothetical protein